MRSDQRNWIVAAAGFGVALLLIVAMTVVSELDGFAGIGRQIFFLAALAATVAAEVWGFIALERILPARRSRGKDSEESEAD